MASIKNWLDGVWKNSPWTESVEHNTSLWDQAAKSRISELAKDKLPIIATDAMEQELMDSDFYKNLLMCDTSLPSDETFVRKPATKNMNDYIAQEFEKRGHAFDNPCAEIDATTAERDIMRKYGTEYGVGIFESPGMVSSQSWGREATTRKEQICVFHDADYPQHDVIVSEVTQTDPSGLGSIYYSMEHGEEVTEYLSEGQALGEGHALHSSLVHEARTRMDKVKDNPLFGLF